MIILQEKYSREKTHIWDTLILCTIYVMCIGKLNLELFYFLKKNVEHIKNLEANFKINWKVEVIDEQINETIK